jgi:SAM-dependent methyltransferase
MDNRTFWNERYESLPGLGSGPGSRAYAAWLKQRLIEATIAQHGVRSVLDIGCGDMYWMPAQPGAGVAYTGVDISDVIVARNRERFPRAEFVLHDIVAAPLQRSADLVVCFDVLIHQLDAGQFQAALRNVLATIRTTGLISYITPDGAGAPPPPGTPAQVLRDEARLVEFLETAEFPRAPTAFHGALPEHIAQLLPQAAVGIAGHYPAQTIYEITLRR